MEIDICCLFCGIVGLWAVGRGKIIRRVAESTAIDKKYLMA